MWDRQLRRVVSEYRGHRTFSFIQKPKPRGMAFGPMWFPCRPQTAYANGWDVLAVAFRFEVFRVSELIAEMLTAIVKVRELELRAEKAAGDAKKGWDRARELEERVGVLVDHAQKLHPDPGYPVRCTVCHYTNAPSSEARA